MQTLILILKFLPMVLEIVKMIQAHRLTAQATQEMIDDLTTTADYLVTRSNLARASADVSPGGLQNSKWFRD